MSRANAFAHAAESGEQRKKELSSDATCRVHLLHERRDPNKKPWHVAAAAAAATVAGGSVDARTRDIAGSSAWLCSAGQMRLSIGVEASKAEFQGLNTVPNKLEGMRKGYITATQQQDNLDTQCSRIPALQTR
jgi:hypothetical protein